MAQIKSFDHRDDSLTSSLVPPAFANEPDSLVPCNEELKASLKECFSDIQSDGSFALFEVLNNAPNPGIHLKKGGGIGLPLSDRDAQAIVEASHAAPFGKGEETIVDTSVRKTWEISPNDFELRNTAWQTYVQTIVAKVSCGLGVDATGRGVVAELYKMLLYEEGAMFKLHQDSEKAHRMFATLVIALPSKHEGGQVRVTHAVKTQIYETSKCSDFDTSYLAWFADVTHEVKPVSSGRRLVLTYNLIHTTLSAGDLHANSNKCMLKLRTLLAWWRDNLESGTPLTSTLAHLLEHQYTDASLCYGGLKGHDKQVVAHLRESCKQEGLFLYLASYDATIAGGCESDGGYGDSDFNAITEECDRNATLKRIVQLDGVGVAQDIEFPEGSFVESDPLGGEPDSEDYSSYTSNEGVSATHSYHKMITPPGALQPFFTKPSSRSRF